MLKVLSDKLLRVMNIDEDLLRHHIHEHINSCKVNGTSSDALKFNNVVRSFGNMNNKNFLKFLDVLPIDGFNLKLSVTSGTKEYEVNFNKTTMRGRYVKFGDITYYKDTSNGVMNLIDIESDEYRDLIIKE